MSINTNRIFFDIGSTLVDESAALDRRIRETLEGTTVTYEQFCEKMIYFAKQGLKGDTEAFRYFGLATTVWRKEEEVPYPDAEDVLTYLKSKGYRLGIIANQSAGTAARLEAWGLLGYFDVIAASAELGLVKPSRRMFETALEMADCRAENAVMIGDRLDNDIYPAARLGMKTVWIRKGFAEYHRPDSYEFIPDHIVDTLTEIKSLF